MVGGRPSHCFNRLVAILNDLKSARRIVRNLIRTRRTRRELAAFGFAGTLRHGEVEAANAERTVVKPIVTHPAVDHRTLRNGRLKRRVRVDLGREGQEAEIG